MPGKQQLEISLFGPGFGECALVHLGAQNWMIVDSCIDQRRGAQPALAHLEALGLEPATVVKVVLITHWHRDHVRGMADVVAACSSAEVFLSEALTSEELLALAHMDGASTVRVANPSSEFLRVQTAISNRSDGMGGLRILNLARSNQILFRQGPQVAEAVALSPSQNDVATTRARFADVLTLGDEERRMIKEPDPNGCAVAVSVALGKHAILLGSDLEQTSSATTGWRAVVNSHRGALPRAQVFKIPHHGSISGHNDDIWNQFVHNPISVLTPFRNSRLPRPGDISRLNALSSETYSTASSLPITPSQPRGKDIALKQSARNVYDTEGKCGHVQVRSTPGRPDEWTVRLQHPARALA